LQVVLCGIETFLLVQNGCLLKQNKSGPTAPAKIRRHWEIEVFGRKSSTYFFKSGEGRGSSHRAIRLHHRVQKPTNLRNYVLDTLLIVSSDAQIN
jgi:hypothetical protein